MLFNLSFQRGKLNPPQKGAERVAHLVVKFSLALAICLFLAIVSFGQEPVLGIPAFASFGVGTYAFEGSPLFSQPSNGSDTAPVPSETRLDHVGVYVRDLDASTQLFSNVLGFQVHPGKTFHDGVHSAGIFFDSGYLELLSVNRETAIGASALGRAEFLAAHEGAVFFALRTSSISQTAQDLRQRNVAAHEGDEPENATYRILNLDEHQLPVEAFFIEYPPRKRTPEQVELASVLKKQPNSACRLASVWVAVGNIEESVRRFRELRFQPGHRFSIKALHARGVGITVGKASVLLLEAHGAGETSEFLKQRGPGIMGVTIEIRDMKQLTSILQRNGIVTVPARGRPWGTAVLIPASQADGIWIALNLGTRRGDCARTTATGGP
jgi:catechol 2,3-dioxygenase-like lactoylglutathione lyase family enzyme